VEKIKAFTLKPDRKKRKGGKGTGIEDCSKLGSREKNVSKGVPAHPWKRGKGGHQNVKVQHGQERTRGREVRGSGKRKDSLVTHMKGKRSAIHKRKLSADERQEK